MVDYVDSLIQQHEMGEAYKRITANAAPTPQLLAFISYDSSADGPIALESINQADVHQQVLNDIETGSAFKEATHVLGQKLQRIIDRSPSDEFIATEGFLSNLFSRVPPYHQFENGKTYYGKLNQGMKSLYSKIPSKFELSAWEKFEETVRGLEESFTKTEDAITAKKLSNGEFDNPQKFSSSGWNKSNYEAAVTWADAAIKEAEEDSAKGKVKIAAVRKWLAEDADSKNADHAKIMKIINSTISSMLSDNVDMTAGIKTLKPMLARVAKYIK